MCKHCKHPCSLSRRNDLQGCYSTGLQFSEAHCELHFLGSLSLVYCNFLDFWKRLQDCSGYCECDLRYLSYCFCHQKDLTAWSRTTKQGSQSVWNVHVAPVWHSEFSPWAKVPKWKGLSKLHYTITCLTEKRCLVEILGENSHMDLRQKNSSSFAIRDQLFACFMYLLYMKA